MSATTATRLRALVTLGITLGVLVGEFMFLMAMFRLDDHVNDQRAAQATVTGALAAWGPDQDPAPVMRAVAGLERTGADGSASLDSLARAWAADPSPTGLSRLRRANAAVQSNLVDAERATTHRVELILASVLVLVSVGWFLWFRKLVRRHRELQAVLTEKQTVDAGERRLLALVQNSADLVAVLEPDSTASFVSPSAATVVGRTADALTGQAFVDLLSEDHKGLFVEMLAGSRDGEQAVLFGVRHADGRDLLLEGTLTNLLGEPAVGGWVLTVRDVTERANLQEELRYQAFHDSLTGLANRQLFGDRLAHALRKREGAAEPLVVMFLDLDDFKHVNDSEGHGIGDQLLVTVAERIAATVREGDTAARIGGDEFAILFEDATVETASDIAERMLLALEVPVWVNDRSHSVQASIGMAQALPGMAEGDEVLRNADVAMYWAKDRGKGIVAVYDPEQHAAALRKLELRAELNLAIREDQLVLHFQPTVELDTQEIHGFEALVRWNHPERGLLPPSEFIEVAEQCGLIVPLGSWVLRAACIAGASMQGPGLSPAMNVNVSVQQLARPDFVEEVVGVLADTGMPAHRLVLEITESVLLDDVEGTITALGALRERGIRVAIDDFGTGYSSLSYLSQLPVDVLKVDKSFVDKVSGSGSDTSLVEAIIAMSRTMRLKTVAEGVEHPEQAVWLQLAQCTMGQGYLWSRPVALEAARGLLTAGGAPKVALPQPVAVVTAPVSGPAPAAGDRPDRDRSRAPLSER